MALIKAGALVTQFSGKIGGQLFGTGRSGDYIKNIGSYVKFTTQNRKKVLVQFSFVSQLWRTLTNEQRLSWNAASNNFPYINRVGDQKKYSGFNLFVKFNGQLVAIGGSPSLVAPSPVSFDPPLDLDITSALGSLDVSAVSVSDNAMYMVFMTGSGSIGRSSSGLNFFLITVLSQADIEAGATIISKYSETLGVPQNRALIHWTIKAVDISTGQAVKNYGSGNVVFSE